jgi:uncharacterized protein (DUF3084 family)
MINQWLNYWGGALPSIDLETQWKDAQNLLQQGIQLYDACVTYSLSRCQPDTWAEATNGLTQTLADAAQDWVKLGGLASGNTDSAEDSEALAALQERLDESEACMAKANTEITSLKRSLTFQKKSLAKQLELAEQSRKAAAARDKQIGALEGEIQRISAVLNQRDKKISKPAAPSV